jgi:hypothetical protein
MATESTKPEATKSESKSKSEPEVQDYGAGVSPEGVRQGCGGCPPGVEGGRARATALLMANGGEAASVMSGLAAQWPKWLRALLFFVLAAAAALAGTLDDWVRILLGVAFVGIGLTFIADGRAARAHASGSSPESTYPTGQYQLPEPEQPDAS